MTHRQTLRALAFDTHGVVSLGEAKDAGVPAAEVRKLASRGALRRVGKGVYRMLEAPRGDLDEFAEAVALVGQDAVLADEAVLAAHDLAQVNLRQISVATQKRVRHSLPPTVRVVRRQVPAEDRDDIDGIPALSVRAALTAVAGRVLPERIERAAGEAVARQLMTSDDADRVLASLRARGA